LFYKTSLKRIIIIFFLLFFCIAQISFAQKADVSDQAKTIEIEQTEETLFSRFCNIFLANQSNIQRKIIQTIFILIVSNILIFGIIGFINRRVKDIKARHIVRKNTIYIVSMISIVVIFFIWIQNIGSITIFLGVAGAGIALALQEVILSVAGWLLILIRQPFEVGDRIEINDIKGDVIDIRLFQTSLLEIGNWVDADQSTGRIVNFPNSFVYKYENYNYSRGFEFIWNEIPILVTFESDWKKGRDIMVGHARGLAEGLEDNVRRKIDAMRNRYMIYYGKVTPIVYVNIKDSGVELTLRYLTEAKNRRITQDQLCQLILDDFGKEESVDLAYPTYRIIKT